MVLTFNQSVASELQERVETPAPKGWDAVGTLPESETAPAPVTVSDERLAPSTGLETASIYAIPHSRRERVSKGKKRTDYKPVGAAEPGGRYWYKEGRKWVERLAPDHAAPVADAA